MEKFAIICLMGAMVGAIFLTQIPEAFETMAPFAVVVLLALGYFLMEFGVHFFPPNNEEEETSGKE